MSGELGQSRADLAAVLELAGLELHTPGKPITPPAILIRPGDPWLEPTTLAGGQRQVTWSVVLIAGLVTGGNLDTLITMTEAAVLAIDGMIGWTAPRSARAITLELNGTLYLASELAPVSTFVLMTP